VVGVPGPEQGVVAGDGQHLARGGVVLELEEHFHCLAAVLRLLGFLWRQTIGREGGREGEAVSNGGAELCLPLNRHTRHTHMRRGAGGWGAQTSFLHGRGFQVCLAECL